MLDPLVSAMGYGWVFTLLGLLDAVSCILAVLALRRWGRGWRDGRAERLKDGTGAWLYLGNIIMAGHGSGHSGKGSRL
jgi:hypothetical protein